MHALEEHSFILFFPTVSFLHRSKKQQRLQGGNIRFYFLSNAVFSNEYL